LRRRQGGGGDKEEEETRRRKLHVLCNMHMDMSIHITTIGM